MSHANSSPVHAQYSGNERTQIEELTDKISELSLVVKKLASSKTSEGSSTTLREEMTCSFSEKTGCSANRCPTNTHRGKKSNYREKMGHIEANCWSK